jgi:hypothetical protein
MLNPTGKHKQSLAYQGPRNGRVFINGVGVRSVNGDDGRGKVRFDLPYVVFESVVADDDVPVRNVPDLKAKSDLVYAGIICLMKFETRVKNFNACRINLTNRTKPIDGAYNRKGNDIEQQPLEAPARGAITHLSLLPSGPFLCHAVHEINPLFLQASTRSGEYVHFYFASHCLKPPPRTILLEPFD